MSVPSIKSLTLWLIGSLIIAAALLNSAAHACVICFPYPETTLADRLLEKEAIVFAREVDNAPYTFYPVEVLRGEPLSDPIKLFCNSSIRRKLKARPEGVIVIARKAGEDWQPITFADGSYKNFVRTIVSRGGKWEGNPNAQDRLEYFSSLLTSAQSDIREQAYLEVGRAPYATIKQFAEKVPTEQIHAYLANFRFIEWHNLYILMLGQSTNPDDRFFIKSQFESSARLGTTVNLGAWVTAFIEAYPDIGVKEVEKRYFANRNRTNEELAQVLISMSILGSQPVVPDLPHFPFRQEIVASYGTLLDNYPTMAGRVAQDLTRWKVAAHVDRLEEIRSDTTLLDASSTYLVEQYISVARSTSFKP